MCLWQIYSRNVIHIIFVFLSDFLIQSGISLSNLVDQTILSLQFSEIRKTRTCFALFHMLYDDAVIVSVHYVSNDTVKPQLNAPSSVGLG
jgi:hypothetical protein